MAYKNGQYFLMKSLYMNGFRSWHDFDSVAKRRKWTANTYLRKKHEIEMLRTILEGIYLEGATDAANEIKETQNL